MPSERDRSDRDRDTRFAWRVFVCLSLVSLFVGLGWMIAAAPAVPLLLYSSALLAIALSSAAAPLERHLGLPRPAAVLGIVFGLLVLLALTLWGAGPRIAQQAATLTERLPTAMERLRELVASAPWAESALSELLDSGYDVQSLSKLLGGVFQPLASAFGITLSALATFFVCGVMATFLAIEPHAHLHPLLVLIRPERRARVAEIQRAAVTALRTWLLGRLISMGAIAVLTFVGLLLLGVAEALALAVLAGILCFIPYVGPVLSAVPAVLATLANGASETLWVLLLYAGIQVLEGNLLTPIIERRTVSIPPAAILAVQLLLGSLFGFLGLLIATPLAVCAIVAIQGFYIEDVLGEDVRLLGSPTSKA